MKPEPLKCKGVTEIPDDYHYDKDIRSAVEWLLEILEDAHGSSFVVIKSMVKEAFEDVMK